MATTSTATTSTATTSTATTSAAASLTIDGFEMSFTGGSLPAELVKATKSRETTNVWYVVAQWLAAQKPGFLTIRKTDGATVKSPVAKIDAAITRCRKQSVANFGKLDCKPGTDKGVWYFVRRP